MHLSVSDRKRQLHFFLCYHPFSSGKNFLAEMRKAVGKQFEKVYDGISG